MAKRKKKKTIEKLSRRPSNRPFADIRHAEYFGSHSKKIILGAVIVLSLCFAAAGYGYLRYMEAGKLKNNGSINILFLGNGVI